MSKLGSHPQALPYQKQADEGEETVPQRHLVLALEDLRLKELQDPQDVEEECEVVLLAELLEVEVHPAVKQGGDHRQVPVGWRKRHGQIEGSSSSHTTSEPGDIESG